MLKLRPDFVICLDKTVKLEYPGFKGEKNQEFKVTYLPSGCEAIFFYSEGWVLRRFIMKNPHLLGSINFGDVEFEK